MTDRAREIAVAFSGQTFSDEAEAAAWLLKHCPPRIFESEEDEGWIATVPMLPGCSAFGATYESVKREICDAMEAYLQSALAKSSPA